MRRDAAPREVGRLAVRVLPSGEVGRTLAQHVRRLEQSVQVSVSLAGAAGASAALASVVRPHQVTVTVDPPRLPRVPRLRLPRMPLPSRRIGSGAMGLAGLAIAGLTLTPSALGAAAAAGQAMSALALVPAAALSVAAGVGVLALAFTGGTSQAREAVTRAVGSLAGLARQAQRTVQARFFAGLATPIRAVGETYLTGLREELTGIASAMGAMASAAAGFLLSPRTVEDSARGLQLTGTTLRALVPGVPSLLGALRDIAAVGASLLPGFATTLASAAIRFGEFVERSRKNGRLRQFFAAAVESIGDIVEVLGNIGEILAGLFGASGASGAGFLAGAKSATAALAAWVNSSAGQANLRALSKAAWLVLAVVGAVRLRRFVRSVRAALPWLTRTVALVGRWRLALAGIVLAALPGLIAVTDALVPALYELGNQVGELLVAVGDGLATVLAALAPGIGSAAIALAEALAGALAAALPAMPGLASALIALIEPTADLAGQVLGLVGALLPLLPPLVSLAGDVLPVWTGALRTQVQVLTVVAAVASGLASVLTASARPTLEGLARVVAGFAVALQPVAEPAEGLASRLSQAVRGAFGDAAAWLYEAGRATIAGIVDGVSATVRRVAESVSTLAERVVGGARRILGIRSPSRVFREIGAAQHIEAAIVLPEPFAVAVTGAGVPVNDDDAVVVYDFHPDPSLSAQEVATVAVRQVVTQMRWAG